jgi:hypothetical protein
LWQYTATVEHPAIVCRPCTDTLATVKTCAAVLATVIYIVVPFGSRPTFHSSQTDSIWYWYDILQMVYWEENAFIYQYSKGNSVDTIFTNSVTNPKYPVPCILNSIKVKVINMKRVLYSKYVAEKVLVLS